MQHLSLTLDTPAENLALDEALLDAAEANEITGSVLRLWESPRHCVILGRSSKAALEVNLEVCRETGIPVLRRRSGGGAVVAGPGCLMYAVVLDYEAHAQLSAIDLAHRSVLGRMAEILSSLLPTVSVAGISDLVVDDPSDNGSKCKMKTRRKISGNALRIKREHFLYHGTLLYDFDLDMIDRLLAAPTRQPNYRGNRDHLDFVTNLPSTRDELTQSLIKGWNAQEPLPTWPRQRTADLVRTKYAT